MLGLFAHLKVYLNIWNCTCILAYLRRESSRAIPVYFLYKNSNKPVSATKRNIKHISKI